MSDVPVELTYAPRVAARLTGVSVDVLRAWERRHSAIAPLRSNGGTRRYRSSDLDRLRLLKAAVDGGSRIGELAGLSDEKLAACASAGGESGEAPPLAALVSALSRLDAPEVHRMLSIHLASLGASAFVKTVALPLSVEIGARWSAGELSIAAEHLATSTLRTQLGSVLHASLISKLGPRIIFATPTNEHHELGLLMAASVSMGAGANPIYLGTNVPMDELIRAAAVCSARAVAVGIVSLEAAESHARVDQLREGLPQEVAVFVGGAVGGLLDARAGVELVRNLEQLESQVALLVEENR